MAERKVRAWVVSWEGLETVDGLVRRKPSRVVAFLDASLPAGTVSVFMERLYAIDQLTVGEQYDELLTGHVHWPAMVIKGEQGIWVGHEPKLRAQLVEDLRPPGERADA